MNYLMQVVTFYSGNVVQQKAVTFYTDKDIHIFIKDSFEHTAELTEITIYLSPKDRLTGPTLLKIRSALIVHRFIKNVDILYAGDKQLIIVTCTLIKNTVNCVSHTRNEDILQLHDILDEMYNNTSFPEYRLILKREAASVIDYQLDVYDERPGNVSKDIFNEVTRPLLLQLDQFIYTDDGNNDDD